ncbi:MAG: FmdB family zinc ribbon protein [Rhodoglobus sp.]
MPTYSYRCTECENAFDIVQAFTDDTLTVCPVCGGKLRKVFSPVGVSFSGSGFYRNDSRAAAKSSSSSSSDSSSSSPSSDSSPAPAKTETKKESKPAAAAAASTSPTS